MKDDSTGKRIKKTIKDKNTTQPEVADKADISKGYLHNIKAGVSKPSVRVLARIAKALGTSIDYLRHGKR